MCTSSWLVINKTKDGYHLIQAAVLFDIVDCIAILTVLDFLFLYYSLFQWKN